MAVLEDDSTSGPDFVKLVIQHLFPLTSQFRSVTAQIWSILNTNSEVA